MTAQTSLFAKPTKLWCYRGNGSFKIWIDLAAGELDMSGDIRKQLRKIVKGVNEKHGYTHSEKIKSVEVDGKHYEV